MSARTIVEQIDREEAAPGTCEHLAQVDRAIEEAERQLEGEEERMAQAAAEGRDTGCDSFELQKMQFLVAILREGRNRLLEDAPAAD